MSSRVREAYDELHKFMFDYVYTNPKCKSEESRAQDMIAYLYQYYVLHIEALPPEYLNGAYKFGADTAVCRGRVRPAAERPDDGVQVPRAEPAVHLRDELRHFAAVALGEAAEYQETADFPVLLALDGSQDGLDGLFLRVADETAGVDQLDIDGTHFLFRHDLI